MQAQEDPELNLYSARKEVLIRPLLDRFTERTGIRVRLLAGKDSALLRRLELEGPRTPADAFLSVDVGHLYRAAAAGLLQPTNSERLRQRIPASLRDTSGLWYGYTLRARTIVYRKNRISPGELDTYKGLADPRWRGRLCVRSSASAYNRSLVAAFVARDGVESTEKWIGAMVRNFARPPQGGDRDQIRAVAAGECDLALVNTYYLAGMSNAEEVAEAERARAVAVFWPDQEDVGTHVNLSGAGVTRYARHPEVAVRLLEFLASDEAQRWFADNNFEYPIVEGLAPHPTLAAWGEFRADLESLQALGKYGAEAVRLMDRAGWR